MKRIIPEKDLRDILLSVRLPGRYVGGEYGSIKEYNITNYNMALCFPDLYEIGMSNQAVKILYREFNQLEGISCERVFAPDKDFEKKLKQNNIFLYTLENGIALNKLDLLGFSIGYELSATTILSILDSGGIPIFVNERGGSDPVIIAGGPAITNPLPFGKFFDGVFIGEAEDIFSKIILQLRDLKLNGGSRQDALHLIEKSEYIWSYNKHQKGYRVKRAFWNNFALRTRGQIPISNINTVQDNGIIEIMRGCPNNCRFCHAGFFYRPYRQKQMKEILKEAEFLVHECGYNEITLSSLSSGDYKGLNNLMKELYNLYGDKNISFSLPSLRINTFTLNLLHELSNIRKSGLTFAVETPDSEWQKTINKEVSLDKIAEILLEARKLGWKVAKFYFMIGLPVIGKDSDHEEVKIAEFIRSIQKLSGIRLNVNVGTFIPKPHTPFQWSKQLTVDESYRKLTWLKAEFKRNPHIKLSYHTPFVSFIEGIISRGDERVGDLIYEAFKKGARLDAWTENFNKEIWSSVLLESGWDVEKEVCSAKSIDKELPWNNIDMGISKKYIEIEYRKSQKNILTTGCSLDCNNKCGICSNTITVSDNVSLETGFNSNSRNNTLNVSQKYLLRFSKNGKAIFLSHINIMNIFQKAFQRSLITLEYSNGFNPRPKMEFAHPLSLGISSNDEIFSANIFVSITVEELKYQINNNLPDGIHIIQCKLLPPYIKNQKKHSLMSLYGGSGYNIKIKDKESITIDSLKNDLRFQIDSLSMDLSTKLKQKFILEKKKNELSDSLYVFLPETGRKISNIMFLLKKLFGEDEAYTKIEVEKIKTSAKSGDALIDYFDLL